VITAPFTTYRTGDHHRPQFTRPCVQDFHGGHKVGESILTIATNAGGTRVLTGDSVGCLRLWDISEVGQCRLTPISPRVESAYIQRLWDDTGCLW